jgi:hypothetical protein
LKTLEPGYLKKLPRCPKNSGKDYRYTLEKSKNNNTYENYTLTCSGRNHGGAADYPQYNSKVGLTEHGE